MQITVTRPEQLDEGMMKLQTMRFLCVNGFDSSGRKFNAHVCYTPGRHATEGVEKIVGELMSRDLTAVKRPRWLRSKWLGKAISRRRFAKAIRAQL